MTRIVLAAHGHLAEALLASAQMIIGSTDGVHAITFEPGQGVEDLYAAYEETTQGEPALFMVDIFGGSPYNAAARWCAEHPESDVVTGVNLAMVIELASSLVAIDDVPTLTEMAESSAADSVRSFRASFQEFSSLTENEGDEL